MAFYRVFSCVFFASIFLVLVCLDTFAAGSCPAGKYYGPGGCHDCPASCYCPTNGEKTYSAFTNAICSGVDTDSPKLTTGWGYTQNTDRSKGWCDIWFCPKAYPNSSAGATSKNKCYLKTSSGKYVAAANQGQVSCKAGCKCAGGTTVYYGSTGGSSVCSAGTYSSGGASSCSKISGGYYGTSGATSSTGSGTVNAGYYSSGGGTSATPSSQGSGCNSPDRCGKIAAGYYGGAGSTAKEGAGKVSAGFYSNGGGTQSKPTGPGNGCLSGQKCGKCADNATSEAGSSYCTCKTGYSIGGGSSTKTYDQTNNPNGSTCAKKTYTVAFNLNGGSGTTPNSKNCTHGETCQLISADTNNFYKAGHKLAGWATAASGSKKYDVFQGTFTKSETLYAVWTKCVSGTYHMARTGTTVDKCSACPEALSGWGKAKSAEGSTRLEQCYIEKSVENCGGYLKKNAEKIGTWGIANASDITAQPGYYVSGTGDDTKCLLCESGTISSGGKNDKCTECQEGQATNSEHTECKECSASEYVNSNSRLCEACPQTYGNMYTLTNDKTLGVCAIKLTKNTKCDTKKTNIIYTYDGTEYVRSEGYTVVPNSRSIINPDVPQANDTETDYCQQCGDKEYPVQDAEGNWTCGSCSYGRCESSGECKPCPAGYYCPSVEGDNLSCSTVKTNYKCGADEFSEVGAPKCSLCASGYSTIYSGPKSSGFDDMCLVRNKGYGVRCTSSAACKLVPAQFCFSPNCKCAQDKELGTGTFLQQRDRCESSFSLGKYVTLGNINKDVIKTKTDKTKGWKSTFDLGIDGKIMEPDVGEKD